MDDPIERERNTEQVLKVHRRHLDSLVRHVRGYSRWDEQLQRTIVIRPDATLPDHQARREYFGKLSPDMRRRLDTSYQPSKSDPLVEAARDARERKSAADVALSDWRARRIKDPSAAPTAAEAQAIRAGEERF